MSNKIYLKSDKADWVHKQQSLEIKSNFENIVIKKKIVPFIDFNKKIHFLDVFDFLKNKYLAPFNNFSLSYYHGYPNSLDKNLQNKFIKINNAKNLFKKIHVTHEKMKIFFLESGISESKIIKLPICIDDKYFKNILSKTTLRKKYNIPQSAFVIGSFQKDGNGWGKGNEMKLVKGPDIFLNVLKILSSKIDNLFIVLSGPSRGYVVKNLKKLNIKFIHIQNLKYDEIINLYNALDLYLITSREEGGPRSFMESLATRTPFVSTPVGMIQDYLNNLSFVSKNFNEEELADLCLKVYSLSDEDLYNYKKAIYKMSFNFTYKNNSILWKKLLYN